MIDDQYKIYEFKELGDERGNLVVIEGGENIPPGESEHHG